MFNPNRIKNVVKDFDKRQGIHKMALLDFITGNKDRHGSNFMINANDELVAIDNGFAAGKAAYAKMMGPPNGGDAFLWEQGPVYGGNLLSAGSMISQGGGDKTTARMEAMDIFDSQVTQETLDDLIASGQLIGINAKTTNLTEIRANFDEFTKKIY